jgi:hypothetical protein
MALSTVCAVQFVLQEAPCFPYEFGHGPQMRNVLDYTRDTSRVLRTNVGKKKIEKGGERMASRSERSCHFTFPVFVLPCPASLFSPFPSSR